MATQLTTVSSDNYAVTLCNKLRCYSALVHTYILHSSILYSNTAVANGVLRLALEWVVHMLDAMLVCT